MLAYADSLIIEAIALAQRPPLNPFWPRDPIWDRSVKANGKNPTRQAYVFARNGCILWNGAKNPSGHGTDGKRKAYRVTYEKFFGEIPQKFQIHHICNIGACCRPDHLLALSPELHRQMAPGRAGRFRNSVNKNERDREIVRLVGAGYRHTEIRAKLGISMGRISEVWNGLKNPDATADLRAQLHPTLNYFRRLHRGGSDIAGARAPQRSPNGR